MPLGLDHVGVYVENLDAALDFYCGILGLARPTVEDKPEHRMRLARVRIGEVDLELIEAPIENTMLRHLPHRGPGLYHLGVRVESTDAEMTRLRAAGVPLLDETPREGDQMRVAFLDPAAAAGVMVELVERLAAKKR
ncbi:MAG: VOC family protein [Candidatus Binatia bacterium]